MSDQSHESKAHPSVQITLSALGDQLLADECVMDLSRQTGQEREKVRIILTMSLQEAFHALECLKNIELKGKRFLEVGCGPGLLATALEQAGIEVVTIEPGGKGIEHNLSLSKMIRAKFGQGGRHYGIGGEDLDPALHGKFDVVFSHNVLEHVDALPKCFDAMIAVLKPGGVVIGHCPNYFIPYEPHYGCWLVPFFPQALRSRVPLRRQPNMEVWHSLNFITFRDVRRAARTNRCELIFEKGLMTKAFQRFDTDPEFSSRQKHLFFLYRILRGTGILALLEKLPGEWSSPMTFTLRKKNLPENPTMVKSEQFA